METPLPVYALALAAITTVWQYQREQAAQGQVRQPIPHTIRERCRQISWEEEEAGTRRPRGRSREAAQPWMVLPK